MVNPISVRFHMGFCAHKDTTEIHKISKYPDSILFQGKENLK